MYRKRGKGYTRYYSRHYEGLPILPSSTKFNRAKKKIELQQSLQFCTKTYNNKQTKQIQVEKRQDIFYSDMNNDTVCNDRNKPIEMQKDNGKINFDEVLLTTVCNCSDINMGEILLMVMRLGQKYSLSWKVILSILEMLNCIFPKIRLPTTKYMLHKLLNVNTDLISYHFLCPSCDSYLGKMCNIRNDISCNCGTVIKNSAVGSFFLELDIKDQMIKLLSNETVQQYLMTNRFTTTSTNNKLQDIYDELVYRKYIDDNGLLGNKFNFSYTINTDGCQAADSSKISVWPIYLMLHELPDHMRRTNMILAGLWVAKYEPKMNIYLQPFVDQANELSSVGITWTYKNLVVVSKLLPLGCCVDSVARCAILSMKKFNGKYGCTYCEHPTEVIDGVRKYPMQLVIPAERTHKSITENMILTEELETDDVMGVRGPSALMNLKYFDLVHGMILDFMHSCLLGVTQLYTTIILTNVGKKYYIGSPRKLYLINQRLMAIRPPSCISKIARSINERNMWTASEWLAWLIFYSLICLKGILPKKYYYNLSLFVTAINILLEESITSDMLENARQLLITFVTHFQRLYGKNYVHYNVHLLLHLCKNVKNWGPLHSINTFPFENQNKLLLQLKKCNYRIAQQITYRLLIYQQLPFFENSRIISDKVKHFCFDMNEKKFRFSVKIGNCTLIGNGKKCSLSEDERTLCNNIMDTNIVMECKLFSKMICKGFRFTIHQYRKCQRRNDSVIQTMNNQFGIISRILKISSSNSEKVIIFFKEISVQNCSSDNSSQLAEHIKRINNQGKIELRAVDSEMLLKPCMIARSSNQYFLLTIVKGTLGRHSN